MKTETGSSRRRQLGEVDRHRLCNLMQRSAPAEIAEMLGIHVQTLLALLAGRRGNHSTVAFVERQLAELAALEVRNG